MDGSRLAVRFGVVVMLGMLVALGVLWTVPESSRPAFPLTTKDGGALGIPADVGVTSGFWNGRHVLVLVQPQERLDGVDALRGDGEATPSVPLPSNPGLRLFAISGTSTRNGCTLAFMAELGASKDIGDYDGDGKADGRMMDVCHHGQWDPYHRGMPIEGTPASRRLPVLDVFVRDGQLFATEFDGDPVSDWSRSS